MSQFDYETAVAEALSAAVPGLVVETSATGANLMLNTLQKPTAMVVMGDEQAVKANHSAILSKVEIHVYLGLRGAVAKRGADDVTFRNAIRSALHGLQLDGLSGPLEWVSTASDYVDNIRRYTLRFDAQVVTRIPAPA